MARIAAKQAAEDEADAPGKELVAMRLDSDILRWLRQSGKRGYSTRINSILRAVMEAR